jgi:hypothetical protein
MVGLDLHHQVSNEKLDSLVHGSLEKARTVEELQEWSTTAKTEASVVRKNMSL